MDRKLYHPNSEYNTIDKSQDNNLSFMSGSSPNKPKEP